LVDRPHLPPQCGRPERNLGIEKLGRDVDQRCRQPTAVHASGLTPGVSPLLGRAGPCTRLTTTTRLVRTRPDCTHPHRTTTACHPRSATRSNCAPDAPSRRPDP